MTVVEFLTARLADDETAARAMQTDDGWVYDPARVLADIAAKRAVIALLQTQTHGDCDVDWCDCGRDWLIDQTARILAAPYASHSDYQQEWTP